MSIWTRNPKNLFLALSQFNKLTSKPPHIRNLLLLTKINKGSFTSKPSLLYQNKKLAQIIVPKCSFSTSGPPKQAIGPLAWLLIKPISKLGAILVGRSFRNWWAALPKVKREIFWAHLKRHRVLYVTIVVTAVVSLVAFYVTHIEKTPITHRERFMLFNSEQLLEIETLEKDQIFADNKDFILDVYSPYTKRSLQVANRLFFANKEIPEVSSINWKLTVIKNEAINAAAFPSGDLIVYTGLLDFVKNDDELAIVLAHEMSHAILQHAAETVSHGRLLDILSIGLVMVLWGILPSDWTSLIAQLLSRKFLDVAFEMPYSRFIEKEADSVGLTLAAKACFDIRYSSVFWNRMNNLNDVTHPEFLSTHPANDTRAEILNSLIPAALQLRKDCKCYDLPHEINEAKIVGQLKQVQQIFLKEKQI